MRVKICGITNLDDATAAADSGADFVGLIFAASARQVNVETAIGVMEGLPAPTLPVLLFRNTPLDEVDRTIAATGGRWVQFHGREPVDYLREVVARHPHTRIIRAWEVTDPSSGSALREYLEEAAAAGVGIDIVILDAPKGGPHPGYECLAEVSCACDKRPPAIWCAGGLTPGNLRSAVDRGRYDGVDVASGIELRPGVKEHAALRAFIETARQL